MPTLTFATGNEGKLSEARAQLSPLGFDVEAYRAGYPEIQADTLEEVARFGLQALANELAEPFILEDAGLFVDALEGFPGVYSSYAFATIGNEGILALLAGEEDRRARFRSVVGLRQGGRDRTFLGEVEGRITTSKRGSGGFGFDPVFQPRDGEATFAEMPREDKIEISHRSRSLAALAEELES